MIARHTNIERVRTPFGTLVNSQFSSRSFPLSLSKLYCPTILQWNILHHLHYIFVKWIISYALKNIILLFVDWLLHALRYRYCRPPTIYLYIYRRWNATMLRNRFTRFIKTATLYRKIRDFLLDKRLALSLLLVYCVRKKLEYWQSQREKC